MSGARVCMSTLYTLKKPLTLYIEKYNIMRNYGIPDKMVRVIAGIYVGFECAVVDGSVTSDWFMIKSGVKQGCVMS